MPGKTSVERVLLSGSTDGQGILIDQTGSPGNTIHTAHATDQDEVFLYVYNGHSASVAVTIEWGSAGTIKETIPFQSGLRLMVPGLVLTNSKVVKAFAGTASVVRVFGYVLRGTLQ